MIQTRNKLYMELKEFIKDIVTQIADAVTELNGGTSKFNLAVNPIVSIGGINKGTLQIGRQECVLTNIEFNLSLTTSENKGSDAKVGVFASVTRSRSIF